MRSSTQSLPSATMGGVSETARRGLSRLSQEAHDAQVVLELAPLIKHTVRHRRAVLEQHDLKPKDETARASAGKEAITLRVLAQEVTVKRRMLRRSRAPKISVVSFITDNDKVFIVEDGKPRYDDQTLGTIPTTPTVSVLVTKNGLLSKIPLEDTTSLDKANTSDVRYTSESEAATHLRQASAHSVAGTTEKFVIFEHAINRLEMDVMDARAMDAPLPGT